MNAQAVCTYCIVDARGIHETHCPSTLPWRAELDGAYSRIVNAQGISVTTNDYETGVGLDEKTATLIVQAVNAYKGES